MTNILKIFINIRKVNILIIQYCFNLFHLISFLTQLEFFFLILMQQGLGKSIILKSSCFSLQYYFLNYDFDDNNEKYVADIKIKYTYFMQHKIISFLTP